MWAALWIFCLGLQALAVDQAVEMPQRPPSIAASKATSSGPAKRPRPRKPKVDRPLSLDAAQKLLEKAQKQTDFPLHLDSLVYRELSAAVGTKGQRRRYLSAFERLQDQSKWMAPIFARYELPEELLLVSVVESSLVNFTEAESSGNSAGIWQFVPGTARTYGLRVDEARDERLHFQKATLAAARYFRSLANQFQDWHLVIVGYNLGENRLLKLLARASRSPGADAALTIDKSYLAKVIAAVILFKVPEILRD